MAGVTLDELLQTVGVDLTQLNKACSDKHLRKIAQTLESWRQLSVHLGLSPAEVKAIQEDGRSEPEKRQQMLQVWQNKFAFKATYRVLVEALLAISNAKMAAEVCSLLKQRSNVESKFLFVAI